jgi:hypothetical protein
MRSFLTGSVLFFCFLLTACSGKREQVSVKFEGDRFEKKWAIRELNPELPSDWSSFQFLTFEFHASSTQRFELIVEDAGGPRKLEILPFQGVWVRASLPLVHFQKMNTKGMDQAAIWKTPRPGCWIGFTGSVGSISQVDSLGVAMSHPIGSPLLEIRDVRLTNNAEDSILVAKPLVDEFGQWIPDDWPGKAKTLDELKKAWTEEETSLQSENPLAAKYGGFPDTKARATGFFRIEKIDGKWWFVDPEGHLFFSNGSCCIGPWSDLSRVKGREYIFSQLPPKEELTIPGILTGRGPEPSFYNWNLYRRFGNDWYKKWMDLTIRRMDAWGINTIGNWSDPDLGSHHNKTYVATLEGWGIEDGPMGMPDIYAPDYAARVDTAAALQCSPRKKDPYLLGYFIGNEPPWPDREEDLVSLILAGDQTSMQTELKKYLASGDTPERRKSFVYETYSKFIRIVSSAIKKYDPDHLNLGFRFGDPPPAPIILASKGCFDVFSINHYGYTAELPEIQNIYELTGLPVIIGEFHFGTPGRGMAPGLAQTKNQEERAVAYSYYVENAAVHPAVIGIHWFQWIDQPSTGRNDGENYNIGLVDVTDRPYPELVNAARETYKRLSDVHSGKVPPVTRQALIQ